MTSPFRMDDLDIDIFPSGCATPVTGAACAIAALVIIALIINPPQIPEWWSMDSPGYIFRAIHTCWDIEMVENLLKELAGGSQTFASLLRQMNSFSFAELVQDDVFRNSVGGLTDLSTVSVVDLFGGKRLVKLASFSGWSASITSHSSVAEQVQSITSLIGLVNLTSDRTSALNTYRIEGVSTADPLKARSLHLGSGETITIARHESFVPDDMDSLYRICSPADQSIWLVIAGPSCRPYFHAFSTETRGCLYSAFPNNVGASANYLAELLK
jgi:hypothetical protein